MKKSILAMVALLPLFAMAQSLKDSGKGAADIVPNGWESSFKTGDLNGDGVADLAIIATPCDKEKMKTRDDGYVYNFNQPILAIYWGEKNGKFKLYKQYDDVIPERPDEYTDITPSLDVTGGKLKISLEYFVTAGSWYQPIIPYTFRYQKGDFFLIGKDETGVTRNTGVTTVTSENYLTHKRTVTTTRPKRKKPTVKTTRLKKSSLKPLGFSLEED